MVTEGWLRIHEGGRQCPLNLFRLVPVQQGQLPGRVSELLLQEDLTSLKLTWLRCSPAVLVLPGTLCLLGVLGQFVEIS